MTTQYWVRVRVHRTGEEMTFAFVSAFERGLLLISAMHDVDVLAQGERSI